MINKYEYKLLRCVKKGKTIKTDKFSRQIKSLINDGYLIPDMTMGNTFHAITLTESGERAYEEYLHRKIAVGLTVIGILVAIAAIVVPILIKNN